MAQRRFNPWIVGGLVVGYIGMLFIVISILTGAWYKPLDGSSVRRDRHVGLFDDHSGAAKACQAMMCLSFIANLIACILGMASSFAVTRPRVASVAIKRLRLPPDKLTLGPKFAGWCYLISGLFVMIASSVATALTTTGYSVIIAWISFALCLISGFLLIRAKPPDISKEPEESGFTEVVELENVHKGSIFKRRKMKEQMNETLPREIANSDTLAYDDDPTKIKYNENVEHGQEQIL